MYISTTTEGQKMNTRYPNIEVELLGQDGNAFAILGKVNRELKKNKVADSEIKEFHAQATSGDYDNLLATVMTWVTVI
jgi:hypothetical protein